LTDHSSPVRVKIDPNGYPGSVCVQADSRLWGIDGNVRREWFPIFAVGTSISPKI